MANRIISWLTFSVLIASAATALLAQAATLEGIRYAESVEAAGKPLRLIGAGLREKWFFDVYTMGAYSQSGACHAAAVISADEVRTPQGAPVAAPTICPSMKLPMRPIPMRNAPGITSSSASAKKDLL